MTSGDVRAALQGLGQAVSPGADESRTDVAILTATAAVIADYGERNLTIDQVAERAGCSRMTVFRRFGSREYLLVATYSRELRVVLESITGAAAAATTAVDCAEIVVTQFIDNALRHPIFIRLLRVEPEAVLALSRGGPDFSGQRWGTDLITQLLSHERLADSLTTEDATFVGGLLMRLVFSLVLIPEPAMDDSPEARASFIRKLVERIIRA
ncbi:TetR/AcrR family transcriptional regulator [Mycobacterium sp. NPDC051198]